MPFSDLPPALLVDYVPDVADPADFDDFWSTTLAESRAVGGQAVIVPAETSIDQLIVEDLTFPGYLGEPIKAWITRPKGATGPLPTVVEYIGYNGGRGLPGEQLRWAASGYVHVFMDTRGQGSGWGSGGDTPDPYGSGPASGGWMTKGIGSRETYYYRRLFTDAVRLIDTVRELEFVDTERIAVTGGSQGGAITLAVAGLVDGLVGVMPDVPFLCDFRRSVDLTPAAPFTEVRTYLAVHRDEVAAVFDTLSYFDGVNFARRATAPALFSVGLMDEIVLPSTVFGAFNSYPVADREIEVYEFNGHDGGGFHQWVRQAGWLADRLAT